MLGEKVGRVLNLTWGGSGKYARTDNPRAAYRYYVFKKGLYNMIIVNPLDN